MIKIANLLIYLCKLKLKGMTLIPEIIFQMSFRYGDFMANQFKDYKKDEIERLEKNANDINK